MSTIQPNNDDRDQLKLKFKDWEASASGRFAVSAIVAIVVMVIALRVFGYW